MKIKWQKKQIRNNKTKKPDIESMRKQKINTENNSNFPILTF